MAAVHTGDHAAAAADAPFPDELREDHRIPLQHVGGLTQRVQAQTDRVLYTGKAFLRQIQVQSVLQIVNDTVAILHDCRGNLDGTAAHQDKLQRVLPGLNAAHGGNMHSLQHRIPAKLRDKTESNRLDRVAAVPADGTVTVNSRR